jgi:lipoate-protein ligase A
MEAVPRAGVVSRARGSATDFHARELPDVAAVWQFEIEHPTIVLGSRQNADVLDVDACRRAGVEIARRRSGGGVVLVVPGATEWVDVVVPATDRRWDDDVRRSMVGIGERWVEALRGAVEGDLTVHRGPPVRTVWSELVCFAGIAAGEVLLDGVKLVGLSQRRTRRGARFQCAFNRHFDAALLIELLADPIPAALPPVATLPAGATGIAERFRVVFAGGEAPAAPPPEPGLL